MRRLLFLTLVLAFVFTGTTNAAVKQGDKELSVYGTYTTDNVDAEGVTGSVDKAILGV